MQVITQTRLSSDYQKVGDLSAWQQKWMQQRVHMLAVTKPINDYSTTAKPSALMGHRYCPKSAYCPRKIIMKVLAPSFWKLGISQSDRILRILERIQSRYLRTDLWTSMPIFQTTEAAALVFELPVHEVLIFSKLTFQIQNSTNRSTNHLLVPSLLILKNRD